MSGLVSHVIPADYFLIEFLTSGMQEVKNSSVHLLPNMT